ncbi:hypothetical protein BDW72DRAFT_211315 [Aspergillus terricola var. indicus]
MTDIADLFEDVSSPSSQRSDDSPPPETLARDALRVPVDQVVRTDHKNLVNVQELYLAQDTLTVTYDSWGISLLEISRLYNIFARDERAVATICKETLRGLSYIHNEVGIAHGNISCGTVILTGNGLVKIADVGESMLQERDNDDKYLDCQAVCQIARVLLELDSGPKPITTLRQEAEEFANTPLGVSVDELLQHPFLRSGVESCSLQPFPILLRLLYSSA